ncbi:MAG: hypothetical protein ACI30J_02040 [Paludibacteraceae bacterium]
MRKACFFTALSCVFLLFLTGCQSESHYPQSLVGDWQSQAVGDVRYQLAIATDQAATLTACNAQGIPTAAAESLSLTYDPNTGKGTLEGSGRYLTLQAANDTAFTIRMANNDWVFTPYTPSETPIIATEDRGYWLDATTGIGLLFCPEDEQGNLPVLQTVQDDEEGTAMSFGIPGFITYTDHTMSKGTISFIIEGDTMGYTMEQKDAQTIVISYEENGETETFTLVHQPNATNAPATVEGVWAASMMGMFTITATVQANGDYKADYEAVMDYETGEKTKGSLAGHIYYSPAAGMGGIVVTSTDNSEWQEELSMYALLVQAASPTSFNLMMGNFSDFPFTFTKQ